jgi:hypothetical protein
MRRDRRRPRHEGAATSISRNVRLLLEERIRHEFDHAFPLLMKVPQTGILRLIDHVNDLAAAARAEFIAALAVRADLLPDASVLIPAKAASLKALTKATLLPLGFAAHRVPGGGLRHLSADLVNAPLTRLRPTSFEAPIGGSEASWDCLTEENAARSVAHLPAMIEAASRLLRSQ